MKGFFRHFLFSFTVVAIGHTMANAADVPHANTLNPNGGTANPDYLTQICHITNVGWARPDSNNTCPTDRSYYSSATFFLASSPLNEFPQKYANHVDATDGYETFLGYNPIDMNPRVLQSGQYVASNGATQGSSLAAWWAGVENVTPFNVNYYNDASGTTLVDTTTCTFGDATGCDVLSPVGLTAPAGKYFDGWFCETATDKNCRAMRYLPADYANLSTPITPYGTTAISNWPNISTTRYRTDLRDANGNIVTNMSYEYTGANTISLHAAWAPYSITVGCTASSTSPFVLVSSRRTQSTYVDENNNVHDIVFGSVIPLDKNFGLSGGNPLCRSVYYVYDANTPGNEQWCSQYLDTAADISVNGSSHNGDILGEWGSSVLHGSQNLIYLLGQEISGMTLGGGCSKYSLYYSCGTFNGTVVSGTPPQRRGIRNNDGTVGYNNAFGASNVSVDRRKYPAPALPYQESNGEYVACGTYTLTPTAGEFAGIPQTFEDVAIWSATDAGHGCCHKPQYAEFKGYRVTRNSIELNDGELIQPGQYGAANCTVSFNENTNPDTWQPGCDLWPWTGRVTLTAVWEHTPIQITLDHNGATNAASLLGSVYMKYGEGFYLYSTSDGYSGNITNLDVMPVKTDDYVFGGYQYCDTNSVCTMVVDSDGEFISGENNLKFTDVNVTATAIWNPASVECAAGTYLNATTQLCETCIAGNYCPGGTYAYNQNVDLGIYVCGNDSWSDDGATQCTACLTANGYHNSGPDAASHAHEASCKTTCGPGQCISVARSACANVGVSGWSAGGVVAQGNTLTCNSCPGQTFTSGSGYGANEAADCGRLLHMGQYQVYLRANKLTSPALQIKIYDESDQATHIYYGNLYPMTEVRTGHMHTTYMGGEYIICDQTGEVCTGVPQEGDPLEQNGH